MAVSGIDETAKPITLIPVGLKEAALDSPTFRAGFTHFAEQVELLEKWLQGYYRSVTKLTHEFGPFETLVNNFVAQNVPPVHISEALIDHDYTLLAMKRYGESVREFWNAALSGIRKMESNMVEPVKAFLQNDLRFFKDLKRNLDAAQKQMDALQSRYALQAKTKEPSSLREDAFQLHEARKAYLRVSMDFSEAAPQLRMQLDKMLVKIFYDQWRDMPDIKLAQPSLAGKRGSDIDRVRGWSREMENGEKAFRKELQTARKAIEQSAEIAIRPSRELEDYAVDSNSATKQRGPSMSSLQLNPSKSRSGKAEKQSWLNLRTVTGKPSRTIWLRRWFYVKNGIFGWLVQGSRSGAVEESEKIGVLLCNVKPSNSDDRRYVFEVKTKDTTIVLQAETQLELNEWLFTFEAAKRKALEDPSSTESSSLAVRSQDPAFAITPPSAPEFAASAADAGISQSSDDSIVSAGVDRSSTLPVPTADLSSRNSFDVTASRRTPTLDGPNDSTRDPASRLMSKLDLHRKSVTTSVASPLASPGLSGGGIASLIAASHGSMAIGGGQLPVPPSPEPSNLRKGSTPLATIREMPTSTLAPNTLANPPAPTNLSNLAVIVNGERGVSLGRPTSSGGVPSGLLANVWGSTNWGFLNRLERGEVGDHRQSRPSTPKTVPMGGDAIAENEPPTLASFNSSGSVPPAISPHRKTSSLEGSNSYALPALKTSALDYPSYYPLQLKTQDAQFRLLFPNVRPDEKAVLVFKATWSPNEQQDFPGRIYVTPGEVYFYSNHCGMTMTTSLRLDSIAEVTAATGRDWDVVFLHLKEESKISSFSRITIKTFLEPLKLLQRRLSFLVKNAATESISTEEIMKTLIRMEHDEAGSSPSENGWENVSISTPFDGSSTPTKQGSNRDRRDLRTSVLIDRGLYGDASPSDGVKKDKSFKLPKQPVAFIPSGMDEKVVEKEFDISPKALFHVMFGDRSAVWQLLYHERQGQHVRQAPWVRPDQGHLQREFEYEIEYLDWLRRVRRARVIDQQIIDSATEHLLYCISDRKTPWHLPYRKDFVLLSKIVITHVAKSRCKLAVFIKVDWSTEPLPLASKLVKRAALQDMRLDAFDLVDLLSDQVRRLVGAHGRTKKAIAIFGHIGQQTQVSEFSGSDTPLAARLRRSRKPQTLASILLTVSGSVAETVVTSMFQIICKCIGWSWNTVTANSLILLLLGLSILVNLALSPRNASSWWQERKAMNFMSRLGVGSERTMSRAIFLHDVQDATALSTSSVLSDESGASKCRDTFNDIMSLSDGDGGDGFATSSASPPNSHTSMALELQRWRQQLGFRRHDLLVALRVVNSMERELLKAEWQRWVVGENVRCRRLGVLLQDGHDGPPTEGEGTRLESDSRLNMTLERRAEVNEWYEDYCQSCRIEGAGMLEV